MKSNIILLLLATTLMISCGSDTRTEPGEVVYWNQKVIDSSYKILYKNKDTATALRFFDSAVGTSPLTPFPQAARFGILANYHYFFTSDNIETGRMIDSALSVFNTPDLQNHYPRTYVGYLLFGGRIAYRLSQYKKANGYFFSAKELADTHLNPCERKEFNYCIAMVLYHQKNFAESLKYFQQAYSLQATCTPQTTAIVLQQQEIQSNIGLCYLKLRNYDSAKVHFENSLEIAEHYKDSLGRKTMDIIYGVVYGNLGKVYSEKGMLNEGIELSLKSKALNERPGYDNGNAFEVKLQLAELYGKKKDFAAMLEVLESIRNEDLVLKRTGLQLEWRRLMSSYYELTSHEEMGWAVYRSYISLRDSLNGAQETLTAADVDRQLKQKGLELKISMLRKDNQLAFVSLWVTVVFSCMALVIIFLIYHNYKRSKKSLQLSLDLNEEINRQKNAREEEIRKRHKLITEAVIRAQEKERSMIGLELHDNINQVLTTVKLHNEMVLESMGDPKVLLNKSSNYLQNCINEIRSLSKRLSAPTLGKIRIEESVKDLIESINLTSKVKITCEISGFNKKLLKQDLHICVYRILQEQLNNVLKHAEATEVFVELHRSDDRIKLTIRDNGKGFVISQSKNGIGLMNMQTRAENLNGSFDVRSELGKGCVIRVVLPCEGDLVY